MHILVAVIIELPARGHTIPGGNLKRIASIWSGAAVAAAGLSLAVPGGVSLAASTAPGGPAPRLNVSSVASYVGRLGGVDYGERVACKLRRPCGRSLIICMISARW